MTEACDAGYGCHFPIIGRKGCEGLHASRIHRAPDAIVGSKHPDLVGDIDAIGSFVRLPTVPSAL
jgi:hypothetical protein